MYSVLIVDDEITIREKLPQIIDFEGQGFRVCASAKNGADALEKVSEYMPELIFLDVRMPVMDGLMFLKELRSHSEYSDIFIVILSGYSDFEYAKKAMEYGVKAYLTKPVDEDEAEKCLNDIKKILDENNKRERSRRYKEDFAEFRKAYNENDIAFGNSDYFIVHIMPLKLDTDYSQANSYQLITRTVSEKLGHDDTALFIKSGHIYSFFIPYALLEDGIGSDGFVAEIDAALNKSKLQCIFMTDRESTAEKQPDFRDVFLRNLGEMQKAVFYSSAFFADCKALKYNEPKESSAMLDKIYERLNEGIKSFDEAMVNGAVEDLFALTAEECFSLETVESISSRIYYLLINLVTALKNGGNEKPMISKISWRESPMFFRFEKWKELVRVQVNTVFSYLQQNKKMKHMGVSESLLEYVYNNFHTSISIKEVAEKFHMNPAYLGRLFQKATGVSFKQYVNSLRIAEAKRLLQGTDKMIYEIAQEVGFSESSYFVSKFTREEGISPLEYRKM